MGLKEISENKEMALWLNTTTHFEGLQAIFPHWPWALPNKSFPKEVFKKILALEMIPRRLYSLL